jgi:hypothetical protein
VINRLKTILKKILYKNYFISINDNLYNSNELILIERKDNIISLILKQQVKAIITLDSEDEAINMASKLKKALL